MCVCFSLDRFFKFLVLKKKCEKKSVIIEFLNAYLSKSVHYFKKDLNVKQVEDKNIFSREPGHEQIYGLTG